MTNRNKGIFFILLSGINFSMMSLFIKLSGDISSIQKSFFRNIIALIISLIVIKKTGEGFHFKKENLKFLLLRAFFGTLGVFANYYAIENLILADATMIIKLSPFFVIIFSFFILKEKIKIWQFIFIGISFWGSIFIINPSILIGQNVSTFNLASLVAVFGAICAGLAYTMIRLLTIRGERGSFIIFFFSLFSCISTIPFMIFNFTPMNISQLSFLILAGIFAGFGQFSITLAYSNAPAREISIFDYFQIIFSAMLGFVVFGQTPDIYSYIGYFIIFTSALFMFIMNNKKTNG